MANNRMYLVNSRTKDKICIAKYYPSSGWYMVKERDEIDLGFMRADFGHLTPEQRAENARHLGLGVPYKSAGGMYGAEWKLELEEDSE